MKKRLIASILLFIVICAFTKKVNVTDFQFLEGTWKIENRQNYESWKKSGDGSFKGHSYKMNGQNIVITEYLLIRKSGDKITYTATVLGQNESKTVDFVLN